MDFKLCQCGCGKELINLKNKFINGHNINCMNINRKSRLGIKHSEESKLKMSNSAIGKIISQETKDKMSNSAKLRFVHGMTGHKHSKDTKDKISHIKKGQKQSQEARLKIGEFRKGKKHSVETRIKLSLSHLNYIQSTITDGKPVVPAIGKNETFILDKIQDNINYQISRYDDNIRQLTGRFPDGYIKELNIIIEIDEPHHYNFDDTLKENDIERDSILLSKLNCRIYRLKEQDFLKNPDYEINKCVNFINNNKGGI